MCELFALSSRAPAAITLSLEAFSQHGGLTGPHKDGWGIAFAADGDARVIKDTDCASASPWVRFLEDHPIESHLVIAHIRRATAGELALKNTQPFIRELGGRLHVFAHNGHVPGVMNAPDLPLGRFRPIGETDSEYAFCSLLARLEALWLAATVPSLDSRLAIVGNFAQELRQLGPANFLYGDGDVLFVHSDRRRQGDGLVAPPGLHLLHRECVEGEPLETSGLRIKTPSQLVVLAASVPLTEEPWRPLARGEVIALRNGQIVVPPTPEFGSGPGGRDAF
ncbi:MAG: class II glutamine amidotransferase [Alphaproteobacteria bacterium]